MQNKNLIRFVQSLVLLPAMTGLMPLGSLPKTAINTAYPQIVLSNKENIEAGRFLALNQAIDPKAEILKAHAEAIDAYFKANDMPLLGTGMKMATEADKNEIDWRLLPAIAVRESTGGQNDCVKVKNNPFGWGSCKIGFDSLDKAIETVALNISGNNPTTAKWYANKTTKQILRTYNPPSIVPRYAEQVISIMNAIGAEDPTTVANT